MHEKLLQCNLFSHDFILKNLMGPNCLKILGEVIQGLDIQPGMRILDLGCGTALTSVFLAYHFDVTVFAADLWVNPSDNFRRIQQFELEHKVYPILVDAHKLPFAREFFDMIISVGAYNFFGTKSGYLEKEIIPIVKKEGVICVSVPGIKSGMEKVPPELVPFLQENMNMFSAEWWRELWIKAPGIFLEKVSNVQCHLEAWQDWLASDNPYAVRDRAMIAAENGKYFDTIQIKARRI